MATPTTTKSELAVLFLADVLAAGPARLADLVTQGVDRGLSKRTLERAKTQLKVTSRRVANGYVWELPTHAEEPKVEPSSKRRPDSRARAGAVRQPVTEPVRPPRVSTAVALLAQANRPKPAIQPKRPSLGDLERKALAAPGTDPRRDMCLAVLDRIRMRSEKTRGEPLYDQDAHPAQRAELERALAQLRGA
ncbi:MAG: hypothetical protein JWM85_3486 [Acidimicrobiaceae bacterium]|nr:hypothetical protein [Acidimicrobiaceae bacterium]